MSKRQNRFFLSFGNTSLKKEYPRNVLFYNYEDGDVALFYKSKITPPPFSINKTNIIYWFDK